MSDVTIVATGLGFPEGPVVCEDGSVVLTEIRHGRCSWGCRVRLASIVWP
jgi:gluconolactonase